MTDDTTPAAGTTDPASDAPAAPAATKPKKTKPTPAPVTPAAPSAVSQILAQYGSLLAKTASDFVSNHSADVAVLGGDAVQAILQQAISSRHVTILPEISADASIEELAVFEATLEGRSAQAALIATAVKADAERVAKLQGDAYAIAEKVGASVVTFGAAILLRGLTSVTGG